MVPELPGSLGELLAWRVRQTPEREAFRFQEDDGGWAARTWRQTGEAVDEVAAGLLSLGLEPEQPVAIASSTRYEWVRADLAVMRAGGATTTVYPSTPPEDVGYILTDSGSVVVIAEDAVQLAKVRDHWARLPQLHAVVVIDAGAVGPDSEHAGDQRVLLYPTSGEAQQVLVLAIDPALETAWASPRHGWGELLTGAAKDRAHVKRYLVLKLTERANESNVANRYKPFRDLISELHVDAALAPAPLPGR